LGAIIQLDDVENSYPGSLLLEVIPQATHCFDTNFLLQLATTFNGCQRLMLDMLGMDLTQPVSSHGQLYTVPTPHSPEIDTETLPKFNCSQVNQQQ
jgi:hypothetical protein